MKPITFPEVNKTYAKDQPEYSPLPVFKAEGKAGEAVSCWQLTWKERLKLLLTGKLWLSVMTFNKPLTPVCLSVNKGDVITPDMTPEVQKEPAPIQVLTEQEAESIRQQLKSKEYNEKRMSTWGPSMDKKGARIVIIMGMTMSGTTHGIMEENLDGKVACEILRRYADNIEQGKVWSNPHQN